MQIIDVGLCVDNLDPKGIGRIRYRPYGLYSSEIERSISYKDWDENDQFIAIPFLPGHINIVPKIGQSVKIIRYDTEKYTQNVEYIWGPNSTPHNFNAQTFLQQHKHTTYGGVIVKDLPDVRDSSGNYIDKKSIGTISDLNDVSINGPYGSDLILTQDGVILRGGKLVNKDIPNPKYKQRLFETPILADSMAKINLKKFPKTMQIVPQSNTVTTIAVSKINYIVEYTIDNLTNPTLLNVYIYKIVNPYGDKYNTNVFTETTSIESSNLKLINTDNTSTTPTTTFPISTIQGGYIEMRELLHLIDIYDLTKINSRFTSEDIHPFYFRPTEELRIRLTSSDIESNNKNIFISSIFTRDIGSGSGLIFSRQSASAPITNTPTVTNVLQEVTNSGEQSFSAVTSDKIYLLSTNTNKGPLSQSINFTNLNQYEYTQSDYLLEIDPKTYSMVRGEVLINILNLQYQYLIGHVHNINKPGLYLPEIEKQLQDAINKMNSDLINSSIKIN